MKKRNAIISLFLVSFLISSCHLVSNNSSTSNINSSITSDSSSLNPSEEYLYDKIEEELVVHYLDLDVSGDSILIDYGNYEILIDAGGSKSAGSNIIVPYLKSFVEDSTIELMIATHGHEDHIAGFVGLSNQAGVLKDFSFNNIVDLGAGYENLNSKNELTELQKQYNELRDNQIKKGCQYYTIRDIFENDLMIWSIAPNLTFSFLKTEFYNIPYTKYTQNLNNYSIVSQLKFHDQTFLFTGDLEKEGEESLLKLNNLSKINVFKAGHHGSNTASNQDLLEIIQPDTVIFTADSAKEATYNFPHIEAINRLTTYTDKFYTSYFNGHIQIKIPESTKKINVVTSERPDIFSFTNYINSYPTILAIAAIGSKITQASIPKIEYAESLYEKLTNEEIVYVYNYETLVIAREKADQL